MKKLFLLITLVLIISSCKTKQKILLENNIKIEITKHTRPNCEYFCHYINFKIINNNKVDLYLPNVWKFYSIINQNNKDISETVEGYEFLNEIDHGHLWNKEKKMTLLELFEKDALKDNNLSKLRNSHLYKTNMYKLVENEFQIIKNEAKKSGVEYSKIESKEIMKLLADEIYGEIIFIPAKKTININIKVNYLYGNYLLTSNKISLDSHGDYINISDSINNPYKYLYENYESTKTEKVIVNFDYKPNLMETDSFKFPIDFFDSNIKKTIKISKKAYPNKLLNKYYLVKELYSKKPLIIILNN